MQIVLEYRNGLMTMFNDLFLRKPILGLWIQLQRSDLFLADRQEREMSHSVVTFLKIL
jgi:hypothetical protein